MKCSEFLNELTNYLDGELDAQTKTELDEHLAWCHNCYVVCDTTRTVSYTHLSHATQVRTEIVCRVMDEIAAEPRLDEATPDQPGLSTLCLLYTS